MQHLKASDGNYQPGHNDPVDISLRYVARTEQTNKQTQRISKLDEKQPEDIQKKRRSTRSKADQKNKHHNTDRKQAKTQSKHEKRKTLAMKKKTRASCTLLRG